MKTIVDTYNIICLLLVSLHSSVRVQQIILNEKNRNNNKERISLSCEITLFCSPYGVDAVFVCGCGNSSGCSVFFEKR